MSRFKVYLAALASVAGPTLADPATECGGASQVEIGACVSDTLARVDASVEIMFGFAKGAAQELDEVTGRASALPALEAGQTAWTAYRDSHCDYVGAMFGGGSGTGIGIESCRIELGRERERELRRYVQ
ncbi:lysozyme inhibitor LprI family protein [Sulfitobacter sp. D35]|uniref:lysozyme inhibitor LprI family protein n=1 Tax=Sulfitobacter sp. D35 TaxID=3083252 RepID=UPI00296E59EC|nr:lysozyme inhibitor LprI family protein [Sulfitobacter sp. D35]MDW4499593.1 lysozyme inhibitor LprI family protein [Sulfitobacter sp. D35]